MSDDANELLSTAEVAARLKVTRQRVLELITERRLPARNVGRDRARGQTLSREKERQ